MKVTKRTSRRETSVRMPVHCLHGMQYKCRHTWGALRHKHWRVCRRVLMALLLEVSMSSDQAWS